MKIFLIKLLIFVFELCVFFNIHAKTIVRIAPPESSSDTRYIFPKDLLEKIFEVSESKYGDYKIITSSEVISSARRIEELQKSNNSIDVIWTPTTVEKESKMLPIKVPIDKGLYGYRVFYIRSEDQSKYKKGMTLNELKNIATVGQGTGWSDIIVLKDAGFVVENSQYNLLIPMLMGKRFDIFPRGVPEILDEYEAILKNQILEEQFSLKKNLVIEKNLILIYPFAQYFFVNKKDDLLAERIKYGFDELYKDNSFDEFWYNHPSNQKIFKSLNLKNRTPIYIPNNTLPKEIPSDVKKYWLNVYDKTK